MNEPLMRRGLSLEGCKIRQKHQSSLLNEDFGVTSQPIHRKIEKNFLKENVMRLKEIQAKCRTQQSRPPSGIHPVKAMRPKNADILPIHIKKTGEIVPVNDGEGSAHSDYFSLPDEAEVEAGRSITKETEDRGAPSSITHLHNVIRDRVLSPMVNGKSSDTTSTHQNAPKPLHQDEDADQKCVNNGSSSALAAFFPHQLVFRRNKIDVIDKIKKQKPACDINCDILWRDIEKQHKTLFNNYISSRLSAATSINSPAKKVANSRKSNNFTATKVRPVTVPRPQSLDREMHLKAKNNKSNSVLSSTFPLSVHPKSLTSLDLSSKSDRFSPEEAEQRVYSRGEEEEYSPPQTGLAKKDSVLQSASLPNLADSDTTRLTNQSLPSPPQSSSRCSSPFSPSTAVSSPLHSPNLADKTMASLGEDNPFHFKDRPRTQMNADTSPKQPFSEAANQKTSNSVATKYDAAVQTSRHRVYKAPSLLRSKSSGNLCPQLGDLPPTYKKGRIPKYLKIRKAEAQHRLEAAAAVDPLCPPGHLPLSDSERRTTLHLLKKGQRDAVQQLSGLPVAQDTLRVRKLKQELETKLIQIEEGIEIFSQPKVYVVSD